LERLDVESNQIINDGTVLAPCVVVGLGTSIAKCAIRERRGLAGEGRAVDEAITTNSDSRGASFGVGIKLRDANWAAGCGSSQSRAAKDHSSSDVIGRSHVESETEDGN
jgi:hypothetical protein